VLLNQLLADQPEPWIALEAGRDQEARRGFPKAPYTWPPS